jgi:hypothetical protein
MAIGPVQLLVLGFKEPDFQGEIRAELERKRRLDAAKAAPQVGGGGGSSSSNAASRS